MRTSRTRAAATGANCFAPALPDLFGLDFTRQALQVGMEASTIVLQAWGELLRLDPTRGPRYWADAAAIVGEMHGRLAANSAQLLNTEDVFAAARMLHA